MMSSLHVTQPIEKKKCSILLTVFLILLVLLLAWHFLISLTALAAITVASISGVIVFAVMLMCGAVLCFYLLKGFAMLLWGVFTLLGSLIGVLFFPFLFPILLPLLFIMLCIGLLRR